RHKGEYQDFNEQLSLMSFLTPNISRLNLHRFGIEIVQYILNRRFVVEFKKVMNKPKIIFLVKKGLSLFHSPVIYMIYVIFYELRFFHTPYSIPLYNIWRLNLHILVWGINGPCCINV
ncbi:MAG: hypothetical protein UX81_C0041G0001, partial [Parcubacteria group bacterium GW2011_GWA2_47_12]